MHCYLEVDVFGGLQSEKSELIINIIELVSAIIFKWIFYVSV